MPSELAADETILLVVDNEEVASHLVALLRSVGDVVCACSVEEALEASFAARVGAVVLVFPMAGSDGLEILDDLYLSVPGVPVLVLTDLVELVAGDARSPRIAAVLKCADVDDELILVELRQALASGQDAMWAAHRRQAESVLAVLDEGVTLVSASGRIVDVNARAAATYGIAPEQLRLHDLRALRTVQLDEGGRVRSPEEHPVALALVSGRTGSSVDEVRRSHDGAVRFVETTARPLVAPGEERAYGVVLSFRDVTEARAADAARRLSERRERAIYEHASEGYVIVDASGFVIEASPTVERHFAARAPLGSFGLSLVHEQDRTLVQEVFRAVRERRSGPTRAELRTAAPGAETWVEATFSNLIKDRAIAGIVVNLRDITERKRAEESMARLSEIVESSADSIIAETLDGVITAWNPASALLYGYSAQEAIGQFATDLIIPPDRRDEVEALRGSIRRGEKVELHDTWRRRRNATSVAVSIIVSPVRDASGRLVGASTIARDVTERRRLEAERRIAEERFRLGFERGAIGMAMIGLDRSIVRANDALAAFLGRSTGELIGHRVLEFVHSGDRSLATEQLEDVMTGREDVLRADRRLVRSDGTIVWGAIDTVLVRDDAGAPFYLFAQIQDITERKRSEQALAHQALHDSLTALPNRTLFYDRLGHAIERASSTKARTAVVFVDIDRFKVVNDSLGHPAGDELLVAIARRLVAELRRSDTVARLGGDEFVIAREGVGDREAALFGAEVVALMRAPFSVGGSKVRVTASAGVVICGEGASVDDSMRDADAAMYRAKSRGGDRAEIFDAALRSAAEQRFDLEQAIASAIARREMRVVYQPILDITGTRLVGAEALLRWDNPEWGVLSPHEFVTVAEETGQITSIDTFVLGEALATVTRWRRELPNAREIWVSVNLSSRELSTGDTVARCTGLLAEHGAPADALRLELTESSVMEDVELAAAELAALRDLGIKVAIDDFGTGHSSLSYLSRLPASALKIDHSFVWMLGAAEEESAIVQAIISLGDTLGLELCAEGIETELQRGILEDLGCTLGQGFLFAAPMAPASFEFWVSSALARRGS